MSIVVNSGPGKRCGSYTPGHEIHHIQARLCTEAGPGEPNQVERVDDDGTIHLVDATTLWNHDPEALRHVLQAYGNDVFVASHGVLRVPNPESSFMFCVSREPRPCRPETAEVLSGESIVDELRRRGGFLRSIHPEWPRSMSERPARICA
jgi:hypothetical protein